MSHTAASRTPHRRSRAALRPAALALGLLAAALPSGCGKPPGSVSETGDLAAEIGSGPVTLEMGQIVLAPEARLMLASANGPALLALDTGTLDVSGWGRVWIRDGRDGMNRAALQARLQPGDGALLDTASQLLIENGGSEPAHALVLAIRPAGEGEG